MALDSPGDGVYPESPTDDVVFPCKGCGEVLYTHPDPDLKAIRLISRKILEEGKAFELGTISTKRSLIHRILTHLSRQQMAHRLLPMQHLRHPARLRREPAPPRRWLPDLQQLHVQLQRLRQQDRRPRNPHWRPGLLRELL